MRVLFITIGTMQNFDENGIYTDLFKYFQREGHDAFFIGAMERRNNKNTTVSIEHGINVLRVRVGNITKTNLIEKGISTLTIGRLFERAINKYWKDIKFDLILYTTPPITIASLIKKLKQKYNAYAYLLLKDIFPQNAIDIGILSKMGFKGLIYRYFRFVEKKLYTVSDKIGCMSKANLDYVAKHNTYLDKKKLEICPNTIDVISEIDKVDSRKELIKYNIPTEKRILFYGGNFGKPQNVPYIIKVLKLCNTVPNIHFVLCGSGTDFCFIESYVSTEHPNNVTVINQLPYLEYLKLISACDFGLLFLDYRFTIPNFPSRLLDYINLGLPVIAATDINTDVGKVIVDGGFGWWVESKEPEDFKKLLVKIMDNDNIEEILVEKSKKAKDYLKNKYETPIAYNTIVQSYDSK